MVVYHNTTRIGYWRCWLTTAKKKKSQEVKVPTPSIVLIYTFSLTFMGYVVPANPINRHVMSPTLFMNYHTIVSDQKLYCERTHKKTQPSRVIL